MLHAIDVDLDEGGQAECLDQPVEGRHWHLDLLAPVHPHEARDAGGLGEKPGRAGGDGGRARAHVQREAARSGTHRVSNNQYTGIMAEQEAEEAGEVRLWLEGYNPGAEPGPATAAITNMGADVEANRARAYEAGIKAAQAGAVPGPAVVGRERAGDAIDTVIKAVPVAQT
jgi:hypothetical protein